MATISVSEPVSYRTEFKISWTGADGGMVKLVDSCRTMYISAGTGNGSFVDYASCAGSCKIDLLSGKGKKEKILATVSFTITG